MAPQHGNVTFNENALQNLRNMRNRLDRIYNQFGKNSDEYIDALRSMNYCLTSIIEMGGYVTAEDDLNLMLDSYIYCGIIFHHNHRDVNEIAGEWSMHS